MTQKKRIFLIGTLVLGLFLILGAMLTTGRWRVLAQAIEGEAAAPAASAPFTYQGQLNDGSGPVDGDCQMAFRLYDASSGDSQVASPITQTVPVSDGLFAVTLDFGSGVFDGGDRWLGVQVQCPGDADFTDLGRQKLDAAPYAHYAHRAPWNGLIGVPTGLADGDDDTVYTAGEGLALNGTEFSAQGTPYAGVVVVAKSGGDYASVQAAIDAITGADADSAYLVWVAPGVYSETVTMKPHVHLQGAGQGATVITSTVGNSSWPPAQATLALTRSTSLCDLTVGNGSTDAHNVALMAAIGTTQTLVTDVTARAQGGGWFSYAIYLTGSGTGVTLQHVSGLAENGSNRNYGLYNHSGAQATAQGSAFTGHGGVRALGIFNGSNATLEATDIAALGENGSDRNYGLSNYDGSRAILRGGFFTGHGGDDTWGIFNGSNGAVLEAWDVTALAENGSGYTHGLANNADATLRGGSFTGRAGTYVRGIDNDGSAATLKAEGVTALAENGSNRNYGLYNHSGAEAIVRSSSFTAREGENSRGIYNYSSGATLEATKVTALAENGDYNIGLFDNSGGDVILHGGSFIGRGGARSTGIQYVGSNTLAAEGVTALAENGSTNNYGLRNSGAEAILHGGSLTGRGGDNSNGIYNTGTLEATGITALGENGSVANYGLYNFDTASITQSTLAGADNSVYRQNGTVTISNSRLEGGPASGGVTCVLVTRGTGAGSVSTDGSTCP